MEEIYGIIISILLAVNILVIGILIRQMNATIRRLTIKTEGNERDCLILTKDINDQQEDMERMKQNIYLHGEKLTSHEIRISKLEI